MRFPPQENIFDAVCKHSKFKISKRPFLGLTPNIKSDPFLRQINQGQKPYLFNSDFESGNLDMVVQTNSRDFSLYMRVDTNTRGHHQWFYFSV
jgi:hypothetical protein